MCQTYVWDPQEADRRSAVTQIVNGMRQPPDGRLALVCSCWEAMSNTRPAACA